MKRVKATGGIVAVSVVAASVLGSAMITKDAEAVEEVPAAEEVIHVWDEQPWSTVNLSQEDEALYTEEVYEVPVEQVPPTEEEIVVEPEITPEEFDLLCRCVYAEVGNQDFLCQQYATDVILNRVDHPSFPNDIKSVITQPGQFGVHKNGSMYRKTPNETTIQAVLAEITSRTDEGYLYFNTRPFTWGTEWKKVDDVWFGKE